MGRLTPTEWATRGEGLAAGVLGAPPDSASGRCCCWFVPRHLSVRPHAGVFRARTGGPRRTRWGSGNAFDADHIARGSDKRHFARADERKASVRWGSGSSSRSGTRTVRVRARLAAHRRRGVRLGSQLQRGGGLRTLHQLTSLIGPGGLRASSCTWIAAINVGDPGGDRGGSYAQMRRGRSRSTKAELERQLATHAGLMNRIPGSPLTPHPEKSWQMYPGGPSLFGLGFDNPRPRSRCLFLAAGAASSKPSPSMRSSAFPCCSRRECRSSTRSTARS